MAKIKFSNKTHYDGKKYNHYLNDEYGQMYTPKGKSIRFFKIFYLYYEKYMFWFRFFDGYGLSGKSLKKKWVILFSERNGYKKIYKAFGWKFEILKPFKHKI